MSGGEQRASAAAGPWVPMADGPPTDGQRVLVRLKSGGVETRRVRKTADGAVALDPGATSSSWFSHWAEIFETPDPGQSLKKPALMPLWLVSYEANGWKPGGTQLHLESGTVVMARTAEQARGHAESAGNCPAVVIGEGFGVAQVLFRFEPETAPGSY